MAALQDLYERDLVRRLRAEFDELPGMRLTFEQATRLTGTDAITCAHALRRLTATGFLERRGVVYSRTDQVLEAVSSAATCSHENASEALCGALFAPASVDDRPTRRLRASDS